MVKKRRTTSGFTQAGAQLVRHFVSDSCLRLSSEPLQYPRLREAVTTLGAMRGQPNSSTTLKKNKVESFAKLDNTE